MGELPTARATLERALAIKESAYGLDHPQVAVTLTQLGVGHDAVVGAAGAGASGAGAVAAEHLG